MNFAFGVRFISAHSPLFASSRRRCVIALGAFAVLGTLAHATQPMLMNGTASVANYTNETWTLQKTGTFQPGATPDVGTVSWTITVAPGNPSPGLAVIGYFDLTNAMGTAIPITNVVVNLQKIVGPSVVTLTSDVADSTSGDAATQATVDPDVTSENLASFQENAASGPLSFSTAPNSPVTLNNPPLSVGAGQTLRLYFVANFNAAQLNLSPGTALQIETIVSFGNNFIMPSLSMVSAASVPEPTVANGTVTLLDPSVATTGTVTIGTFSGLNQTLTQGAAFVLTVPASGGMKGGTVCNTATLTSPDTPIALLVDNTPVPLLVLPGVSLAASDCQDIPKKPCGPSPIVTTLNSCSQVVAYDASLFTSPCGTIVSATFNPASGSTFPFGTSTVNYSVTDSSGATATGTLTVNVLDTLAPVIAPVENIEVPADAGKCTAVVTYSTTATDCNLATLSFSPASGSEFPIGTSVVTITATDTAGHVSTSTFTVTVTDATAPVLHASNLTLTASGGLCGTEVTFNATADDCSETTLTYALTPTFSSPISSGASFPIGTTTVYVKAVDAFGNTATTNFTVTVLYSTQSATSSIKSNFNSQMPSHAWLWFNSHIAAKPGKPATLYVTNASVSILGKSGTIYTYPVPDGKIVFTSAVTCASTIVGTQGWVTTVPLAGDDEIFLAGLGIPTLPDYAGSSAVTWKGTFTSDTPGFTFNWQWGAACYTYDMTQYASLGVKASHGSACSTGPGFNSADHAGTPEAVKTYLVPGARGGGGSNFTGSWSNTGTVTLQPCR